MDALWGGGPLREIRDGAAQEIDPGAVALHELQASASVVPLFSGVADHEVNVGPDALFVEDPKDLRDILQPNPLPHPIQEVLGAAFQSQLEHATTRSPEIPD
jgi:hypothetical protein